MLLLLLLSRDVVFCGVHKLALVSPELCALMNSCTVRHYLIVAKESNLS
jgi:hypothetical protein